MSHYPQTFTMSSMPYIPIKSRYKNMIYNRLGHSGLKIPAISLGLWHNFGHENTLDVAREMCRTAFDLGITHFDLANNYGVPYGSAEANFGEILKTDFADLRDEMVISSKAGYDMWPGPYGEWGSRKYLLASLDQSLARMELDYVDIFYSHRYDPETPLEETMGALDSAVKQGKALYVGISSYPADETRKAANILRKMGTPCLVHQPRYSIFDRTIETEGVATAIDEMGIGCVVFSPLEQGLLTGKYLSGIPEGSRAEKDHFLKKASLTEQRMAQISALNDIASRRGQSLAQMALSWVLNNNTVNSAIIGASRPTQITDCVQALSNLEFTTEDLEEIDRISGAS